MFHEQAREVGAAEVVPLRAAVLAHTASEAGAVAPHACAAAGGPGPACTLAVARGQVQQRAS